MNEEIQKVAEMIIRKHKEQGGSLVWNKQTFEKRSNTTPAKEILIDLGYIKWASSLKRTTTLTPKGWDFASFEHEKNKYNPETEKLSLEIIALRNQIFDYKAVRWQAKWGLIIAAIAATVSIFK